jgi:hypothetical protein
MVTDAAWFDYDKDRDLDLVVVGEWMPITLFKNNKNRLVNVTKQVGLEKTNGWWNCVIVDDLNDDGHTDFVAGNLGKNSKIQASESEPAAIYVADYDNNALFEPILCFYKLGKSYPMPLRPELVKQLPALRQKFRKHSDYAGKQITEIFSEEQLRQAVVKEAYTFASSVFYGNVGGTFIQQPLPIEAQFSPVYAIMAKDFDADGVKDLLLAGNFHGLNPQLGRHDASYGTLLKGSHNATFKRQSNGQVESPSLTENTPLDNTYPMRFTFIPMRESGLSLTGQVRDMVSLRPRNKQEVMIFAKNDDRIQIYEMMAR